MAKKDRSKELSITWYVCSITIIMGFIWLNTFIHQNSFDSSWGSYEFLKIAVIAAVCTVIYYWCFFNDSISIIVCDSTRLCAIYAAVSGIIMLFALLLELGTESFSIYGQKEIELWWISIPKMYFYDLWTVVWFPTRVATVFKALNREYFKKGSILFTSIAILELTLEGILIFRPMSNIYQVDLIVLNVATIMLAVWKYAFTAQSIRKGNAIGLVLLYTLTRVIILPLQCNNFGAQFSAFMYGDGYSDYLAGIREITSNASLIGTSTYLRNSQYVLNWLQERNKPIAQLLYYGGWVSVIVFIGFQLAMICILIRMLGLKNSRNHSNWLIFATGAAMLSSRAVFGTLYNFGIPYPVSLPFLGNHGSPMDVMAFTLVMICAMENIEIVRHAQLPETFIQAENVLGISDAYTVLDENLEPYTEEIYYDDVVIVTQDRRIRCTADWYGLEEREFCVFTKGSPFSEGKHFIMEFSDGKWIVPTDYEDLYTDIINRYVFYNKPNCMEEWEDEELDNKDSDETIFKENIWLLIAALVMSIIVFAFLWKWSLKRANAFIGSNSVNALTALTLSKSFFGGGK